MDSDKKPGTDPAPKADDAHAKQAPGGQAPKGADPAREQGSTPVAQPTAIPEKA